MSNRVPDSGRARLARGLVLLLAFIVAGQAAFDAIHASLVPLLPLALMGLGLLLLFGWLRSRRGPW